ncbi:MAG: N-acetylglucosamine-6-phosphate deacetylase [Christensenellales bacterium]
MKACVEAYGLEAVSDRESGMIIIGARVLTEGGFAVRDVAVRGGLIVETGREKGLQRVDARGMLLIPGLVDTHFHGALNEDFRTASAEAIGRIAAYEAAHGIATIVPAISAAPDAVAFPALEHLAEAIESGTGGARIAGIHMEGPFLSERYRGGMRLEMLQAPSPRKLEEFQRAACGYVRLMTIAPELPGALDTIRAAREMGIVVSIGHTGASYEEAMAAIEAGATVSTHTFNAMRGLTHRTPGVLAAVLTDERVSCEVIADFVHVHPAVVKLLCRVKGAKGFHLVSDSMYATGMPDGDYKKEGVVRHVRSGVSTLDDGRIAGSTYTILTGLKHLVSLGFTWEEAVNAASLNPARALGLANVTGSITPGMRADLALMDEDFNPRFTLVGGEIVYEAV